MFPLYRIAFCSGAYIYPVQWEHKALHAVVRSHTIQSCSAPKKLFLLFVFKTENIALLEHLSGTKHNATPCSHWESERRNSIPTRNVPLSDPERCHNLSGMKMVRITRFIVGTIRLSDT